MQLQDHMLENNSFNAFTIDVEDGLSFAMKNFFGIDTPQTNRVEKHTYRILELLERYNTKGTFFIVGKVAEDFPELICDIHKAGHEVGIHGYNHLKYDQIDYQTAYNEIHDTKKLMEDIIGSDVKGHRAPAFSINNKNFWVLDILADAGFLYDSSIVPAKGPTYGYPGFNPEISEIKTNSGKKIIEVPLSVTNFLGKEIPAIGGSYLRLFPLFLTNLFFKKIMKYRPVIFYMHPYEIDTERYPDYYFDALKQQPWHVRQNMKSKWINRKTVYAKIESLLKNYNFLTVDKLIKEKFTTSMKIN